MTSGKSLEVDDQNLREVADAHLLIGLFVSLTLGAVPLIILVQSLRSSKGLQTTHEAHFLVSRTRPNVDRVDAQLCSKVFVSTEHSIPQVDKHLIILIEKVLIFIKAVLDDHLLIIFRRG